MKNTWKILCDVFCLYVILLLYIGQSFLSSYFMFLLINWQCFTFSLLEKKCISFVSLFLSIRSFHFHSLIVYSVSFQLFALSSICIFSFSAVVSGSPSAKIALAHLIPDSFSLLLGL